MKLFNNRKRREPVHRPLMGYDDRDRGWPEHDSSAMHSDYAVHMQALRDRTIEQEKRLEQEYNSRKNLGDWVKTLNCSSAKKLENFDHDLYPASSVRNPREIPWTDAVRDPDITRPVLITVKDGDVPHWAASVGPVANDFKTSFAVGPPQPEAPRSPRSPSRFNLFRRASKKTDLVTPNQKTRYMSKEVDDLMTSEELARRSRWRRGIERSWKDDGDIPSLISNYEDESVLTGCRSTFTGGESFATGFTNATSFTRGASHCSATTGYTTDITDYSDESEVYNSPARSRLYRNSPDRAQYGIPALAAESPPRRKKRSSVPRDSLLSGMAEDLGIIAGLLLSDGNACVGGVADITRDTLTSCKPHE
eukprot:CAMPEP_0116997562 /NCGR_PEP_ID=MMETSP0472-20121206/959_1 /TAXON_ID=693140 ORGANISM="Tiarina fusus, Strain LIS" /NCGR_SAMPLE_ID=MMETSP0472 /ASSEMBLY_ACC=CAM_ASM_000603 /LENGTH=363 /DNA_ID=CAMNT_0004696489 /DNA_START=85 /DNA_END=1176 /DNA_ORIENTATION=-